jgi:dihydroneopterin triphosphate diphosphatase
MAAHHKAQAIQTPNPESVARWIGQNTALMNQTPTYKIPISVLVVVYTADMQVLLIERADAQGAPTGFWQSVTGSLDAVDEPTEVAARREVAEETGIASAQAGHRLTDWRIENVYAIYPTWLHRYAPGVTHNTEHVFGLQVPTGSPIRLNPREHVAFQWLPYRAAADKCFSSSNAEAVLMLPRFT